MPIDITDPGVITTILTAGGAPVWSGVIQGIIQVFKAVPQFKSLLDGREKLTAFLLSALAVGVGFAAAVNAAPPTVSLDLIGIVGAVLAWFTVARLAMALYDDFTTEPDTGEHKRESVLNSVGWTGPKPEYEE